jgi:hypothetical protein
VRKHLSNEHVEEMAGLLRSFLNREGVRTLRRRLHELVEPNLKQDIEEQYVRQLRADQDMRANWLREHPSRTGAEFGRLVKDEASEVWQWWPAKGDAIYDAE